MSQVHTSYVELKHTKCLTNYIHELFLLVKCTFQPARPPVELINKPEYTTRIICAGILLSKHCLVETCRKTVQCNFVATVLKFTLAWFTLASFVTAYMYIQCQGLFSHSAVRTQMPVHYKLVCTPVNCVQQTYSIMSTFANADCGNFLPLKVWMQCLPSTPTGCRV